MGHACVGNTRHVYMCASNREPTRLNSAFGRKRSSMSVYFWPLSACHDGRESTRSGH